MSDYFVFFNDVTKRYEYESRAENVLGTYAKHPYTKREIWFFVGFTREIDAIRYVEFINKRDIHT